MSYDTLNDAAVFELAKAALLKEASLPAGSIERSVQTLEFDAHMMELRRRAFRHVIDRLRQRDGE